MIGPDGITWIDVTDAEDVNSTYRGAGIQGYLQGPQGNQGPIGPRGSVGYSAYEIALLNGFVGTQQNWLDSIKVDKVHTRIWTHLGVLGDILRSPTRWYPDETINIFAAYVTYSMAPYETVNLGIYKNGSREGTVTLQQGLYVSPRQLLNITATINDYITIVEDSKTFDIASQTISMTLMYSKETIAGIGGSVLPTVTRLTSTLRLKLDLGETLDGNARFQWNVSNVSQVFPVMLKLTQDNVELGQAPDIGAGTITVSIIPVEHTTVSNVSFKLSGTNVDDIPFAGEILVKWLHRVYYGVSNDENLDDVVILTSTLKEDAVGVYNTTTGGYKYIMIPTDFMLVSTFKDNVSGMEVAMLPPYEISITNIYGVIVHLNVYRSVNILGGAINIAVN
jgi:hypothetical protein